MTDKQESTIKKVQAFLYPTLMSVIGFFFIQSYNELQDIKRSLNVYLVNSATLTETSYRHSMEIEVLRQEVKALHQTNKVRDDWVRDWTERWMPAVNWADNEKK